MKLLSLVFSFRNEEENLEKLIEKVNSVISKLRGWNFEYIFVNDDSTDNSEKISSIIKESLKKPTGENYKIENSLSIPLKEARENFEKEYLTTQLKKFGGNISKTAEFVGMERSALHRKLKGLGVKDLN